MIVVRRPFRNLGKMLTAGTVISNPAVIKHLKSRFAEGKLVEVNEHNFETYYNFFKQKYGVDLPKLGTESSTESSTESGTKEKGGNKPSTKGSVKVATAVVK